MTFRAYRGTALVGDLGWRYLLGMRSATMMIEGMTCGGCVVSVKRVLERVPGVSELMVEVGEAHLTIDDAVVTEAALRQIVERAGFEVHEVVWE